MCSEQREISTFVRDNCDFIIRIVSFSNDKGGSHDRMGGAVIREPSGIRRNEDEAFAPPEFGRRPRSGVSGSRMDKCVVIDPGDGVARRDRQFSGRELET